MWGNTNGWILSAAVALVMGYMWWYLAAPPQIPAPTGSAVFAVAKAPVALPVSPATVVSPGTQACDAGDLYRKAIKEYDAHHKLYDDFLGGKAMETDPKQLKAVDYLVEARNCNKCNLFASKPAELVNYDNDEPGLHAIEQVGTVCRNLGLINRQQKAFDAAHAHLEAAFILGTHLFDERLSAKELLLAHDMLQKGATSLSDLAQDENQPSRTQELQHFAVEEKKYVDSLAAAFNIINHVAEEAVGKYAGDIFAIAEDPKADTVFRVEAIKHIGHYRFNAMSLGEQFGARRVLKKLPDEPGLDPAVKTAAIAARDLTSEQHQNVGASVD